MRDHETRARERRTTWYRCSSGAIGRRKTAVEKLLDALEVKLADEPRLSGDRVYVQDSEARPLLRFARTGILKCHSDGHEDAAGRFLVALASVDDAFCWEPWSFRLPVRTRKCWPDWVVRSPRMVSASAVRCGITIMPCDLHALVSAARYWAAGHWPGIVAMVYPDIRIRGKCEAPSPNSCARVSVRVCSSLGVMSTSGWSC